MKQRHKPRSEPPRFLLMDGRAASGSEDDLDRAAVLDTADSEAEAREAGKTTWEGHDAIWMDTAGGASVLRYDLPPAKGAAP